MNVVLDACAVIAYERDEPGADVVETYLVEDHTCWIHAINLCEVYYDFLRVVEEAAAEQVLSDLKAFDVQVVTAMEDALWKQAATYKAILRRISLADCFALALANQTGGVLITSDHAEFDPVVEQKLCNIQFIR